MNPSVAKSMPQTLTLNHVSPATRLLEKRRQMFEVQEALDAQKEEFARREDAFKRREDGLRKKDLELQESLIKFNKFLQENESKRNRAVKRASDERKIRESKEGEIQRLQSTFDVYSEECEKLSKLVEKNMKYSRFLETVQEIVPEEYPEITDLVNRCNTLKDANKDLSESQRKRENENENKRVEYSSFAKERTNEILNFNNEIAKLQKNLEVCELNANQVQNELDISVRNTSDKTLELGQILNAVGNLLRRCTSGMHGSIIKHSETTYNDDNGNSNTNINSTASHPTSNVNNSESFDIEENGRKAKSDLDVIAAYMLDFKGIVEARVEAQKLHRKNVAAEYQNNLQYGTNKNNVTLEIHRNGSTTTGFSSDTRSNF